MSSSNAGETLGGIGAMFVLFLFLGFIGAVIWAITGFMMDPSAEMVSFECLVHRQDRTDKAYIIEHHGRVKSLHVQHGWEENKTCWICDEGITINTNFDTLKSSDYDWYYLSLMQKDPIEQRRIMPTVKNTDTLFILKSGSQIYKHISGHLTAYPLNW